MSALARYWHLRRSPEAVILLSVLALSSSLHPPRLLITHISQSQAMNYLSVKPSANRPADGKDSSVRRTVGGTPPRRVFQCPASCPHYRPFWHFLQVYLRKRAEMNGKPCKDRYVFLPGTRRICWN